MSRRDKVIQPRATRFWHEALPPVLLVCFVLLVWQTVAVRSGLSAFILPSPIQVAQATFETNRRRDGHLKLAAQIALSNPCRFTDRADSGDRAFAHYLVWIWASAEGPRRDPDLLLSVGSQYG